MILLQSQPFGWRDPWAVVNHTAAASALCAVCTVLHRLMQLSLSGSRPVNDLSRRSRSERCRLARGADRVIDVEPPQALSTARGEGQPSISSGIFETRGCY